MYLFRNTDKGKFQIDFTIAMEYPFYEEEVISLGTKTIKLLLTDKICFVCYCKSLFYVLKEENYVTTIGYYLLSDWQGKIRNLFLNM